MYDDMIIDKVIGGILYCTVQQSAVNCLFNSFQYIYIERMLVMREDTRGWKVFGRILEDGRYEEGY